jgi:hypothetical protein
VEGTWTWAPLQLAAEQAYPDRAAALTRCT